MAPFPREDERQRKLNATEIVLFHEGRMKARTARERVESISGGGGDDKRSGGKEKCCNLPRRKRCSSSPRERGGGISMPAQKLSSSRYGGRTCKGKRKNLVNVTLHRGGWKGGFLIMKRSGVGVRIKENMNGSRGVI